MPIETTLRKRPAKHAGELGLFPDSALSHDDMELLPSNEDIWIEATTPRNQKLMRFLWALATKLAYGGLFGDKDEAMSALKVSAKFARFGYDKQGRIVIVPKSLARASGITLARLADRMVFITCTELLPGMAEGDLRNEIERMIG
jgi:hypothetical protein